MTVSICAKCGGHTFERDFVTPLREARAIPILQCADCGVVVGTLDSHLELESLQKQIAAIDAGLIRIAKALSEM
jgi:hypothetical protein